MDVDLDFPQLSLGQLLKVVPGLTVGRFQNWNKRGILSEETASRAKKNAHIKLSIRSAIVARILLSVGDFNFQPSRAIKLARFIADQADDFVSEQRFESERDGVPQILFKASSLKDYRRCAVSASDDGTFSAVTVGREGLSENHFRLHQSRNVYLVIEADLIFADTINLANYVLAGFDPAPLEAGV